MRIVESKYEYTIQCQCGLRFAFSVLEFTQNEYSFFICQRCNTQCRMVEPQLLISTVQHLKESLLLENNL